MKKSKYIGKYDYIGYYTKQKAMWFYSNSEVLSGIQNEINNLNYSSTLEIDYDEQIEENLINEEEIDVYEYYKELLEENRDIDKNDPKIIEGIIIDSKTKKYILDYFKYNSYIDFDDIKYKFKSMEELAEITKDFLLNNNKCIIFQPVFIYKNLITKCDALIKNGNEIHVIETKATSSSKLHHYLDLFYQKNLIENQDYLKGPFKYSLCILEFEKCNKYEATFAITPFFNITKSTPVLSKKIKNELTKDEIIYGKKMLKQGYRIIGINEYTNGVSYDKVMESDFTEIMDKGNLYENKIPFFLEINSNFWNVINELQERKDFLKTDIDMPYNFTPSAQDNSDFKKNSFWVELKALYVLQGFQLFKYSGYVVDQTKKGIEKLVESNQKEITEDNIIGSESNKAKYEKCFLNNEVIIDKANCLNLLNQLKEKKVYFDFETINTAIRSLDNTLPFSQIITQCSIIKSNNKVMDSWECNNLVCDPKNIKLDFMKEIVDSLYEGSDTSYIVYNQSFEKSRLMEIGSYLNDEEYWKKIIIITTNLYDLADFFDCRKNYILLPELYGFYSIKKVLVLIEKYKPEIFKICKCKDYKKLEVKNGAICQQKTIKRFLDMLSDDEWKELEKDLKIYCENDVRAMIAVELYIKDLLKF